MQIKNKDRVKNFGEVFTKEREVNAMLDLLPDDMFYPNKTFLEPACGEGVFIIEILKRKFKRCRKRSDYTAAISSIYGIDIQADNVETTFCKLRQLCEQYIKPTKKEIEILRAHIIQGDALKIMSLLSEWGEEDEH